MKCIKSRGMNAILLTASEEIDVGMHSDIYEPIWIKLYMIIDSIEHCMQFDANQSYLDIHSRSQACAK